MIELQLYDASIADIDEKLFDFLFKQLPTHIQQVALDHHHWQDKRNIVIGKTILKNWLTDNNKVETLNKLEYETKERPYFANANFDFNISHSKEIVACAFGSNRIGLDLEKHRNIEVQHFQKYFNANELLQIMTAEKPLSQFFRFWTIKEAAIKHNGKGVSVLAKTSIVNEEQLICEQALLYYKCIDIGDFFSCSIVNQSLIENYTIKWLTIDDLL